VTFRTRHLQEDRLFECYLAQQVGEPMEPPAAEHLADCGECAARYADLRRFMDGLRLEADADFDRAFPPERLRAQQDQIARRIEQLAHPARVISFPGYRPTERVAAPRVGLAPRWLVATAAASLAFGVGVGSFIYPGSRVGISQAPAVVSSVRPADPRIVTTAAPQAAPTPAVSDTDFLSELELALERPRTSELDALDALTPHVREAVYEVR